MRLGHSFPLLLLSSFLAACEPPVPEPISDVATTQAALTNDRLLIHRGANWDYSDLYGPREADWASPTYVAYEHPDWYSGRGPFGYGETYLETPFRYNDANNKPPTVYLREGFFVDDLDKVKALRWEAMFDDGYVVYLNGHEIKRASMPTGAVTYDTLALGHEATANVYESSDVTAAALPFLVDGGNLIAVEVHQAARSSSDLVFDAALIGQVEDTEPEPEENGIRRSQVWSTWDAGGDLGSAWAQPSYDVSAWRAIDAPTGYGEPYLDSTVSYGPSATNKYVTTYFRRDFTVADPAAVTKIRGQLMYDDGVVVYLNGQRIGSAAMPAGATNGNTLALGHEANNVFEEYDWTAQKPLLRAGVNTLAVEVHQQSRSSSDLVFDASIILETASTPPPPASSPIAKRSSWRHYDSGNRGAPLANWRTEYADDIGWGNGFGPLGYGEPYLQTTIGYGPDPSHKPTAYFRKLIDVPMEAGDAVTSVIADVMFDDGVVIYVNGVEIKRLSMPTGTVTHGTFGRWHEAGNVYEHYDLTASAASAFRSGVNVVAVEVHQDDAASSDLVFDLALDVKVAPQFRRDAANPVIVPGDEGWRAGSVYGPHVIKLGPASYVMYFTGSDNGGPHDLVGRATSTDGIHWTLDADPVADGVLESVVYDAGTYYLYTSSYYADATRVFTSTDGVSFTYQGTLFDGERNLVVLKDATGWHLWASSLSGTSAGTGSSSDGIHWTFGPAITPQLAFDTVIADGGIYKAWYGTFSSLGCTYATSPDGVTWTVGGTSLAPAASGWDSYSVGCSSVLREGSILRMWYGGYGLSGEPSIGTAVNP